VKNPQFHKWAKHIRVQYHLVREQEHDREIVIESYRPQQQTTNMLTKPLLWAKHKQYVSKIGLAAA